MRFVSNPNLPDGRVVSVIAGGLTEKSKNGLEKLGVHVIELEPDKNVDSRIRAHSDLVFLHIGGKAAFYVNDRANLPAELDGMKIQRISAPLGAEYPDDCRLNCAVIGKHIICNIDTADSCVLKYFSTSHYDIIAVKQGYTKCSVLPVTDSAIITDDLSVYNACRDVFDTLYVEKRFVNLPGFDYGFIGGAGGKISRSELVFTGNIYDLSVKNEIERFCAGHGVECIFLSDEQIYDVGSLLPITEE